MERAPIGTGKAKAAPAEGDTLTTSSQQVAIAFGKQHAKVMRTIKGMLASKHPEIAAHGRANFGESTFMDSHGKRPVIAENARSNFGASSYVDSIGRRPMYRMTAKGLTALALGFTGKKAMGFKDPTARAH